MTPAPFLLHARLGLPYPLGDEFVVVAGRHMKARAPALPQTVAPLQKTPAENVAPGSSYAGTVRKMRAIDAADVLTVTGLRRTRKGHVLVQMQHSKEEVDLADRLRTTFQEKLGDSVNPIASLDCATDVEIVDLDPVATEVKVLEALRGACRALPGGPNAANIQVTGL